MRLDLPPPLADRRSCGHFIGPVIFRLLQRESHVGQPNLSHGETTNTVEKRAEKIQKLKEMHSVHNTIKKCKLTL